MKKLINSKKIRSLAGLTAIFVIFISSYSCSKSSTGDTTGTTTTPGGTSGPGTNEVFIQGMAFSPSNITVAAGTTITWTNKDAVAHTVTSNTNVFNSGNLANGKSFTFTFATPGSYPYYCSIHPYMVATVTVN